MQSIIYLFVSPSGRAYAGRHTCQHEGWPRRGSGALPSGYRGSGKLWANVTRRHGSGIRWAILRRFGPGADRAEVNAAERRAIRLVRHLWRDRCVNISEGGDGFTSGEAQEINRRSWANPEYAAKVKAALPRAWAASKAADVIARRSEAARAAMARPEVRARHEAAIPGAAAKRSATCKARREATAWHSPLHNNE
jgi:hypothetical protein